MITEEIVVAAFMYWAAGVAIQLLLVGKHSEKFPKMADKFAADCGYQIGLDGHTVLFTGVVIIAAFFWPLDLWFEMKS